MATIAGEKKPRNIVQLTKHYMDKGFDLIEARDKAKKRLDFEKEVDRVDTKIPPKKVAIYDRV